MYLSKINVINLGSPKIKNRYIAISSFGLVIQITRVKRQMILDKNVMLLKTQCVLIGNLGTTLGTK